MAVVVATGIVLSVAQTLLTALQTKELKELCSNKYESELRKLEDTVTTIKAVLMDAEFKPHDLNYEGQDWFKKLKDAVYDVDDLLDEYKTIAQQLKGMPGGKISKKVRQFFSGNNQFLFGFNKSREIKKIREYLDCIAKNRKEFGSSDHYKHVKRSREITCSRVEEQHIIGRDIDKEVIVDMLLSDSGKDVSFVSIVGMGGLGKTALAQLVFNDHRIKGAFGDLRYWVCVSDQFGMKEILSKMLQTYGLDLEKLQIQARSELDGKKYLLVLDDVWCDKREHWVSLINFLAVGEKGSKILVTSRSREVANVSGTRDDLIYQLKVLSEEESWDLFKSKAFKEREELEDTDLVDIGREITKKCGNVPLSLKVIGNLLYGQNKSMWVSFQRIDLEKMRKKDEEDRIISTLMFSYYNLTPELKSCFGICSLFPKDYIFKKEVLIQLWLAQGYLVATHDGESLEDVGEEYFSILLQRCFFEDVDGSHGEVLFCKMHDLIHDLAQEVAGEESLMLSVGRENTRRNIRHLSISDDVCLNSLSNCSLRTSRTFLQLKRKECKLEDDVGTILSQCRHLRVLILSRPFLDMSFAIRKLPDTLGKLLHLRYLNLSFNRELEMLPKSITKLHNLQILELCNCWSLKALPEDISKLVNLRALDIEGCDSLTHMPTGMYTLTCLRKLTMFVFDRDDLKLVKRGEPKDLKALVNHKGKIRLKCLSNTSNITDECDISKDENLQIEFLESDTNRHLVADVHEMMLEHVYNIDDLKSIDIDGYEGINLPSWASPVASYFPKLKRIELQNCNGLIHISSLSQLYHLKFLKLTEMENVEYMEKDAPSSLMPFFPSLEKLEIEYMNNLKGWWKDLTWKEETGGGSLVYGNGRLEQAVSLPSFPVLRDLCVGFCESMTYFPPCPHVKILRLDNVNEELRFCTKGGILPSEVVGSSSVASKSYPITETLFRLEELCMWSNARVFNSLFRLFVQGAIVVKINLLKAKSIERLREGFHRCALSLQDLQISYCYELKSLRLGGMEHLTNLKSLEIRDCTMLDLKKEEGMPWKCLHSLSSLKLWGLPRLSNLPIGFQYLRNLESLEVSYCKKLKTLPEWLDSLSSLQRIRIERCPKLKSFPEAMRELTSLTELQLIWPSYDFKERCRNPDGDDWSKIQHIPHFLMKYSDNFNDQDNADDSDDSDAEYDEDYDDVDDDDEDEDDDDDNGCLM